MYPHAPYSAEKEIEMIAKAIERSGRAMVLSLSPGPAVIEKAWHMEKYANMWRITDDFWDQWDLLKNMFERCEVWQRHVSPGNWPDCDMLPLGHIGMGFRKPRITNFTRDEQVTMMTLWSIFRSPLMVGGELRDNDDWTLSLLTNEEVLRLIDHSSGAQQLERSEAHAVWKSLDEDGSTYVALFNLSDEPADVGISCDEYDLNNTFARDVWKKKELGPVQKHLTATLAPHGAALYRLHR
jgi:hypothetical protein